jgi:uncharacterized membrane protein
VPPGAGGLSGSVEPGGTVTYNLSLVNPEPRQWVVDSLGPGSPAPGWEAATTPSVSNGTPSLALGPLGSLNITLELQCPPGEPAGKQVGMVVTAKLSGSPYAISMITTTTVLGVAGVSLECNEKAKPAAGGNEVAFTVAVHNTGNYDNRVNLSLSGEAAGWARLGKDYLLLTAGGRAFVQVTASVPKEAFAGAHNVTVTGAAWQDGAPVSSALELSVQVNATQNLKIEKAPTSSSVNLAQSAQAVLSVEISNYGNRPETVRLAPVSRTANPGASRNRPSGWRHSRSSTRSSCPSGSH